MIRKLAFLTLFPVLLVVGFYGWFEYHSDKVAKQNNLSSRAANAIKHADAARVVYGGLRLLKISPEFAEKAVKNLGYLNERLELVVKSKKDSSLEMAKDLHNNMVGMVVGQKCEKKQCSDAYALLILLVRDKVLITNLEDMRLSQQEKQLAESTQNLQWADDWLRENLKNIRDNVDIGLDDK